MLHNRQWVNQYVHLAETLPELLLSCKDRSPSKEEIEILRGRIPAGMPLYVELGSGSGQHILTRAQNDPGAFYMGFELRYKRAVKTAEKAHARGLKNIFVVRGDMQGLSLFFPTELIDGIYINFPDPWDRKKWKKHRMLSETTLPMFQTLLKPHGFIRYKTDHEGYFDDTLALISKDSRYTTTKNTRDLHASDLLEGNVLTEFEQLFLSKRMPIYFAEFVKAT